MNEVTREEVLALALRADRCGQGNLATNLYAVVDLMGGGYDGETISGIAAHDLKTMATRGAKMADKLGIGFAAGMVS